MTRDPIPTSYPYSSVFYASIALVATAASLLTVIAGVFAAWRIHISRTLPATRSLFMKWVWIAALGYYGAGAISAALNPSDAESVAQLVERLPFLCLPSLVTFFANTINPEKLLRSCIYGAMAGIAILALYWSGNRIHSGLRFEAISGNSNVFGYTMVVLFVWLLAGFQLLEERARKILCGIAVLTCVWFILFSGSRAAMLAMLAATIIMLSAVFATRWTVTRVGMAAALLVTGLLLSYFTVAGARAFDAIVSMFNGSVDISRIDEFRPVVWACGLEAGTRSPLFGLGHDGALAYMTVCAETSHGVQIGFSHFHNLFIDQFAKGGIVGLVGASALMVLPPILLWGLRPATAVHGRPTVRLLVASGCSMWLLLITSALFNIGLGHDAIDAVFIYNNALIFGLLFAINEGTQMEKVPDMITEGPSIRPERIAETDAYESNGMMKNFVLGAAFASIVGFIVFLAVGYNFGYNRLSVALGGYAVSIDDTANGLQSAQELREFIDRLEAELTSHDSAISFPDTESFHHVSILWPEQFAGLSPLTRRSQSVAVRKSGANYKILMSGPICPVAVASGLFQPDPKRTSPYKTLCTHFAEWNGDGEAY